jgi:N-sulfoglucosamine sulfohydrolase
MIEHLKEIGELDNTIIIATADNGAYLPVDGKYLGKASPYEYGVHVPLAIMWPEKIQSSRVVEDFVSFADIAPTLLEAANIEVPVGMTGDSLTTIFNSTDSGMIENRDFMRTGLEWHGEFDPVSRSTRSIRKANYSYLVRYNNVDDQGELLSNAELTIPASEEFYDLTTDPWQLNNLIDDPKHKQTLEKMRQLYVDSGQSMNDPRVTGEMDLFRKMRQYVQKRKKDGYRETSRMSLGD